MLKVYLDLTGWNRYEDDQPDKYTSVELGYIDWIKEDGKYVQVLNEYIGHWYLDYEKSDRKTWCLTKKELSCFSETVTHSPQYWRERPPVVIPPSKPKDDYTFIQLEYAPCMILLPNGTTIERKRDGIIDVVNVEDIRHQDFIFCNIEQDSSFFYQNSYPKDNIYVKQIYEAMISFSHLNDSECQGFINETFLEGLKYPIFEGTTKYNFRFIDDVARHLGEEWFYTLFTLLTTKTYEKRGPICFSSFPLVQQLSKYAYYIRKTLKFDYGGIGMWNPRFFSFNNPYISKGYHKVVDVNDLYDYHKCYGPLNIDYTPFIKD